MAGLHAVLATALSAGTHGSSITEHLAQRYESINLLYAASVFDALDLSTTGVQVADNVAHVLLGNDNGNLHDRLHNNGACLSHSFLECHRTGNLKCHFGGVDLVVRTIIQGYLYVNNGIASHDTGQHSALDTLVNRLDKFLGDSTAGNSVDKLVSLTGLVGLKNDLNVTVLDRKSVV